MIEVSCFYSLSSPWAYFAGPRMVDIARRHHASLILKPYDFQAVVTQTGGVPLRTRPPARRTYHARELDRWRKYLGMPMNLAPKYYPELITDADWNKRPGWMVIAAQEQGLDAACLSHALLRALWAEERDTSQPAGTSPFLLECPCTGANTAASRTQVSITDPFKKKSTKKINLLEIAVLR